MSKITLMILFFGAWVTASFAQSVHQPFTDILKTHVKDGLVNYQALCREGSLREYTGSVSTMDPSAMGVKDSMAFWINAYNAFTLQLICDHYPVGSINDIHTGGMVLGSLIRRTAWDRPFIKMRGEPYTLNDIEHKILRPRYKDARIHFAIVCAAKSCPPLRSEAYEGSSLDEQLHEQATTFLGRSRWNSLNTQDRTAHISAIFKWFRADFGKTNEDLLLYLSRYLPAAAAGSIQKDPGAWRVKFNPYDWALNEQ